MLWTETERIAIILLVAIFGFAYLIFKGYDIIRILGVVIILLVFSAIVTLALNNLLWGD